VKCFTLTDLFAGKMHALIFRKWKENAKGRDWYDFEWYVKKGIAMNLSHFIDRAHGGGHLADSTLTRAQFRKLLTDRISSVDMERVKADAVRFIPGGTRLDIWSRKYFNDLAGHLKFH
jgi:hypothetical protein